MEENTGCECSEKRNSHNQFYDELNRSSERFDQKRRLATKPFLAFKAIERVYQYRKNAIRNITFPNLLRISLSYGLNEDIEGIENANDNNYEHFCEVGMDNCTREMRNRTKTTDKFSRIDLGLKQNVSEDDNIEKIRTTLPTQKDLSISH
ncbi:MAG: hypothetical protein EZS28_005050 [Streblomastix strix]|uniref:Uncharacterized protein n=1 Tax=Streblomastix strix TaxID=222440 RepID=A0A5J4WWY9_9EUKA|nr:MAG: hypothetical protein EZS28_005050 [Streblomastix strix]